MPKFVSVRMNRWSGWASHPVGPDSSPSDCGAVREAIREAQAGRHTDETGRDESSGHLGQAGMGRWLD